MDRIPVRICRATSSCIIWIGFLGWVGVQHVAVLTDAKRNGC